MSVSMVFCRFASHWMCRENDATCSISEDPNDVPRPVHTVSCMSAGVCVVSQKVICGKQHTVHSPKAKCID